MHRCSYLSTLRISKNQRASSPLIATPSAEAMDSFSESVLGKDPVTRRNRTLVGGAILLGGICYWMTQRHGENEPQRLAQDAKEKAKQEAERIQQSIEDKARGRSS